MGDHVKILSTRARSEPPKNDVSIREQLHPKKDALAYVSMVADIKLCADDPVYFIERYILAKGQKLTHGQREVLRSQLAGKITLVNRARTTGMTTLGLAHLLWHATFKCCSSTLAISFNHQQAVESSRIVKQMYDRLPEWLRSHAQYSNKQCIEFANNSRIAFQVLSDHVGRGLSLSAVFIDDMALSDEVAQKEAWASLAPSIVGTDGSLLISSIPSTKGDTFCLLWKIASTSTAHSFEALELDFRDIVVPFDYDAMKQVMDEETFMREYMCEFTEPVFQSSFDKFETRGEGAPYRNRLAPHERDLGNEEARYP